MPSSLECTTCGAKYYTAATGRYIELVALLYRCQACDAWEPLDIRAVGLDTATAGEPHRDRPEGRSRTPAT